MIGTPIRGEIFFQTGSADWFNLFGRGAIDCPDERSYEIDMSATQNPPEKMMFQLTLRRRGISDQAVLRAMEEIPRDIFVQVADRVDAYRDSALGIACGQTISQPFVVAYMTEQLQLRKDHKVLEIGTGSGYQAAVLSRLCAHVLTIERYRTLADTARDRLEALGYYNIEVMYGDGFDIPAGAGDFDRIILDTGFTKDRSEWSPGQFDIADGAHEPWIAVAAAFKRQSDFLRRPRLDLIERERLRLIHEAFDAEFVILFLHLRDAIMADVIEIFGRNHPIFQLIPVEHPALGLHNLVGIQKRNHLLIRIVSRCKTPKKRKQ